MAEMDLVADGRANSSIVEGKRRGPWGALCASVRTLPRASVAITVLALLVAMAHLFRPGMMNVDAVALALLGAAVLPWIGDTVAGFKIPNWLEVEFRDRMAKVEDTNEKLVDRAQELTAHLSTLEDTAEALRARAEHLQGLVAAAENLADVGMGRLMAPTLADETAQAAGDQGPDLDELAARYDRIRREQPAGPQRTVAMSGVVGEMISLLARWGHFPVQQWLHATGGQRLAAYAHLYARPERAVTEPRLLADLVWSVGESDPTGTRGFQAKPFEQFWGVQAIGAVVAKRGAENVEERVRHDLRQLLGRFEPGTDRHSLLARILQDLEHPHAGASPGNAAT